jgi:hypothetical protein
MVLKLMLFYLKKVDKHYKRSLTGTRTAQRSNTTTALPIDVISAKT